MHKGLIAVCLLSPFVLADSAIAQFDFGPLIPSPLPSSLIPDQPLIPVPNFNPTLPGNSPTVCNPFASQTELQACQKQFQNTSLPPELIQGMAQPPVILPPTPSASATAQPTPTTTFTPPPYPRPGLVSGQDCPAGSRLRLLPGGYVCLPANP